MTPDAIYSDFIRYEDRSADLYLDLSVHFWDQIDLSWFWVEMAMGGKQRAGLVQYCLENKVFTEDLPDNVAIQELGHRLEELSHLASNPALSLDGAFDIAIQIETPESHAIRARLTKPIQSPPQLLQKKLSLSGTGHFARLKDAAERFAVSPAVRSRLALPA